MRRPASRKRVIKLNETPEFALRAKPVPRANVAEGGEEIARLLYCERRPINIITAVISGEIDFLAVSLHAVSSSRGNIRLNSV